MGTRMARAMPRTCLNKTYKKHNITQDKRMFRMFTMMRPCEGTIKRPVYWGTEKADPPAKSQICMWSHLCDGCCMVFHGCFNNDQELTGLNNTNLLSFCGFKVHWGFQGVGKSVFLSRCHGKNPVPYTYKKLRFLIPFWLPAGNHFYIGENCISLTNHSAFYF